MIRANRFARIALRIACATKCLSVVFPTSRLSINSSAFDRVKLIETDKNDWSCNSSLKMTENWSKWIESPRELGKSPLNLPKVGFSGLPWKVGQKNLRLPWLMWSKEFPWLFRAFSVFCLFVLFSKASVSLKVRGFPCQEINWPGSVQKEL